MWTQNSQKKNNSQKEKKELRDINLKYEKKKSL